MHVGARTLRAKLSEYLERAARGEIIVVTDYGRPRAVLGPVPRPLARRKQQASREARR